MRKLKITWGLVMAVTLMLVLSFGLASCAPAPTEEVAPTPTEEVTTPPTEETTPEEVAKPYAGIKLVHFSVSDREDILIKEAAEFKAMTGIDVEIQVTAYANMRDKLTTALMAGEGPIDTFDMDLVWVPGFASGGWVVEQELTPAELEGMIPATLDASKYNGKYYARPFISSIKYFWYNAKILEEAGIKAPPLTWKELTEQSLLIQEKGLVKYANVFSWAQDECLSCDFMILNGSFGGKELVASDGSNNIDTPETRSVLQWMADSIYKDKITDPASITFHEDQVLNVFLAGDSAFMLNWELWPHNQAVTDKSPVEPDMRMALMPGTEANPNGYTINGPWTIAIAANSTKGKAAEMWLEFLTSKAQDKMRTIEFGSLPIWSSNYEDPEIIEKSFGKFSPVMDAQNEFTGRQAFSQSWYIGWSEALRLEVQNVLVQKKTPEQALKDLAAKTEELATQE